LIGQGVFEELAPGSFALSGAAEMMRDDHPSRLRIGPDLDAFGNRMAYAWGSLLSAVRSGKPAYEEIFALPFWEDLNAHPEIAASFDDLMGSAGHGVPDPEVLVNSDWDSVQVVADVGGGNGTLLAEILKARPETRGILVNLPRTVARSDEIFSAAGVADRVTTIGQSFFDPLPAGADLYLLRNLLDDWADPEARMILQRCAEAAPKGSRDHRRCVPRQGWRRRQSGPPDDGVGRGQESESV
jgi:2,7-dihydroxy-5-methyl-1-naphthoate 7-O-methyltransferase